jgi:hypothetical protein
VVAAAIIVVAVGYPSEWDSKLRAAIAAVALVVVTSLIAVRTSDRPRTRQQLFADVQGRAGSDLPAIYPG